MPSHSRRFTGAVWTRDYFERSVKYAMELDKAPKALRVGTIILEGDIKCRLTGWDDRYCIVKYGPGHRHSITLTRKLMNFRYAKAKVHVE